MKRLLDADVFINAPVIKSHGMTRMTASLKNLMGLIYDRQAFHSSASLEACIADLGKALSRTSSSPTRTGCWRPAAPGAEG